MTARKQELLDGLLTFFLAERPGTERPSSYEEGRNLLRALLNIRAPRPVPESVLKLQDELLTLEQEEKGVCTLRTCLRRIAPSILLFRMPDA